jgi:Zn-dependent M28 family amino/carboxypeptidase
MHKWIGWVSLGLVTAGCGVDKADTAGVAGEFMVDSGIGSVDEGGPAPEDTAEDPGAGDMVVSMDGMLAHLNALNEIANENGGNRAAGTAGYGASADYVREELEAAGYSVQVHEFDIITDEWASPPGVELSTGTSLTFETDFFPFSYSGSGIVTAPVTGVDLVLPPGDEENSSTSGCESADFSGFPEGNIALIQRGSCSFQDKSSNAVAAGAAGVLIFNEGQPGRTELFAGTLDAGADNPVPVFALSFDAGASLATMADTDTVTITADVSRVAVPTMNLFAETTGDPDRAVVVGAHMDSVLAGPGINDNGSGVAMILELALQIARDEVSSDNQLRFMFWGGEELGLLGSLDYVLGLSEEEHGRILANLNFDMIASPNPTRMVYDGSGRLGGGAGPDGSIHIEQLFSDWFDAQGMAYTATPFDGRSDYGPFIWTGIPAGGLFTGAEQPKPTHEAETFGGTPGEPYDPCYHLACDSIDNLDLAVLDEMAAAAAAVVLRLGAWEGPLSDGLSGAPVSRADQSRRLMTDWVPTGCGASPKIWRR